MRSLMVTVIASGLALSVFYTPATAAEVEKTAVFERGVPPREEGGYHTYRIPAIVTTPTGMLLVFCEGRKFNRDDHGNVDMLMRRSGDGGRTWTDQRVIHEEGGEEKITIGNPCPVVDRQTGVVHLAYSRDNKRIFIITSDDDGATWTEPREITDVLEAPDAPWVATGPGHGVQIQDGEHAGRLCIPSYFTVVDTDGRKSTHAFIIYSDDQGETWKRGGITDEQMGECIAVQRFDGSILLDIRQYTRNRGCRAFAISSDGGATWSESELKKDLPCPNCQGSIVRHHGEKVLLHSGPIGPGERRRDLTISLSRDDGATWPVSRVLHGGPAAYSDLVVLPDGTIGCLYEGGPKFRYETITFARFPVQWLTENK